MKRFLDIFVSLIGIIFLLPLFIIVSLLIFFHSGFPIIYYSQRYGLNKKFFIMPKFRTMNNGSPEVATHLLSNPDFYINKLGRFLRKSSIDELPQLFSVLKGDMSLVGPRPALFNQYDLINYRDQFNINDIKPGITGLAQIRGRDSLNLKRKIKYERIYIKNISISLDIHILLVTIVKVLLKKNVKH